jgi:hypothetical protein
MGPDFLFQVLLVFLEQEVQGRILNSLPALMRKSVHQRKDVLGEILLTGTVDLHYSDDFVSCSDGDAEERGDAFS